VTVVFGGAKHGGLWLGPYRLFKDGSIGDASQMVNSCFYMQIKGQNKFVPPEKIPPNTRILLWKTLILSPFLGIVFSLQTRKQDPVAFIDGFF